MAEVIAQEAAALGVNSLFASVVGLAQKLRLGRVEGMYSEDAYPSGGSVEDQEGFCYGQALCGLWHASAGVDTALVRGGER